MYVQSVIFVLSWSSFQLLNISLSKRIHIPGPLLPYYWKPDHIKPLYSRNKCQILLLSITWIQQKLQNEEERVIPTPLRNLKAQANDQLAIFFFSMQLIILLEIRLNTPYLYMHIKESPFGFGANLGHDIYTLVMTRT